MTIILDFLLWFCLLKIASNVFGTQKLVKNGVFTNLFSEGSGVLRHPRHPAEKVRMGFF